MLHICLILAMITPNPLSANNSNNGSPIPFEVRPLPPQLLATIDTNNHQVTEDSSVSNDPEPSTSAEVDAQNTEEQKASKKKGSKRGRQSKCKNNGTKKRRPL